MPYLIFLVGGTSYSNTTFSSRNSIGFVDKPAGLLVVCTGRYGRLYLLTKVLHSYVTTLRRTMLDSGLYVTRRSRRLYLLNVLVFLLAVGIC